MATADPSTRHIIVAGDSHCLAYEGVVVETEAGEIHFHAAFASSPDGFFARSLVQEGGRGLVAHPALVAALDDRLKRLGATADCAVVLTLAGPDFIVETMNPVWRDYDFHLAPLAAFSDRLRRCIPLSLVSKWIGEDLQRIGDLLRMPLASGRRAAAVLLMPPPHRKDQDCLDHLAGRSIDGSIAPFVTRAKIAELYRQEIRRACYEGGIALIDSWSAIADDHALKAEFEMDGFHVSPACVAVVAPIVVAALSTSAVAIRGVRKPDAGPYARLPSKSTAEPTGAGRGRMTRLIGRRGARVLGNLLTNLSTKRSAR